MLLYAIAMTRPFDDGAEAAVCPALYPSALESLRDALAHAKTADLVIPARATSADQD